MTELWQVDSICLDNPDYFEILNGLWTGKKPPFAKAGVIRNTNFTASGEVDYSDVAWLDVETKQLAKRQLKHGDIIIERSGGGPRQPVGRVVQFRRNDDVFSFSNFTTAVRIKKPDVLNPLFAFYVLLELYQSGKTDDIQRRTTGLRNLDFKAYKERAYFPLISFDEQRRIAHILSTVQYAIEQQARIVAVTTELKKALIRKLFTEGLRGEPQKETEIGRVPQSWDVMALEKTGDVVYGIQAAVANNLEPIGTKILTNKNITLDGQIDLEKVNYFELKTKRHFETVLKKGDLLFNWRSGSKQHVGKTAYFDLEGEYTHSSFILRIRPNANVNGRFLYYYFNLLRESGHFVKIQTYSVNAKFNKSAMNALPTFVPKRDEQDEIASTLDCVQAKIQMAQRKHASLNDLFRTLLHQLMTGQVRVNEDLTGLRDL